MDLMNLAGMTPRGISPDMATVFHARNYHKFIEIKSSIRRKKLHRTSQGSSFLGGSFSNRGNIRTPVQSKEERPLQHLKDTLKAFDDFKSKQQKCMK